MTCTNGFSFPFVHPYKQAIAHWESTRETKKPHTELAKIPLVMKRQREGHSTSSDNPYHAEMKDLIEGLLEKDSIASTGTIYLEDTDDLVEGSTFLAKLMASINGEKETVWGYVKQFQQMLSNISLENAFGAISLLNNLETNSSLLLFNQRYHDSYILLSYLRKGILLLFLLLLIKDTRQGGNRFLREVDFTELQLLLFFDVVASRVAGRLELPFTPFTPSPLHPFEPPDDNHGRQFTTEDISRLLRLLHLFTPSTQLTKFKFRANID